MDCRVLDLGLTDFNLAQDCQNALLHEAKNNGGVFCIVLYQSHPVITLGRNADIRNILADPLLLEKRQIEVHHLRRGGDVTYHGPGQLIAYPVFNLKYLKKDISYFLKNIEEAVIRMLGVFGLAGRRCPGKTGVWIGTRKISSIGVAFSNWVSYHGVAVNIQHADLSNFSLIRPCGMDVEMTSLESELNREVEMALVKSELLNKFREVFGIGRYVHG